MPEWLRTVPTVAQTNTAPPAARAEVDPTLLDTGSFVSENDLPDWIRQIAVQDAAAAGATVPPDEQPSLDVTDLFTSMADAPDAPAGRIAQLLGEPAASGPAPASSAWLARRQSERQTSQSSGARAFDSQAAFAGLVSTAARAEAMPSTPSRAEPAPTSVPPSIAGQAFPGGTHIPARDGMSQSRWLRPVLLALLLLVVAILVYQMASGG
jgi:hypothetical protein